MEYNQNDDPNDDNNNNDNDEEYQNVAPYYEFEDELDDEEAYDRISQDEIDEILAEPGQANNNLNPTDRQAQQPAEQPNEQQGTTVTDDDATVDTTSSRPNRERSQPERLTYFQDEKEDADTIRFEESYKVLTQEHPNPDQDRTYEPQKAMVIARLIGDIQHKATIQGASFMQQYIFQRGRKKFGQRGDDAASKELDQLHRRNCFTPIDGTSKWTKQWML